MAQRADDNAVSEADDAFGVTVGNENLGLYNPYDARGFSPVDAGNARIDGLYFDQQFDELGNHISDGSTIRIGIAAQGYPLPAPTGIADYSVKRPGDKPVTSLYARFGPYRDYDLEADFSGPLASGLGIAGGATFQSNTQDANINQKFVNAGLTLLWQPSPGVSLQPFIEHSWAWGREATPLIFLSEDFLPPRVDRLTFFGQDWTARKVQGQNAGVLARAELGRVTLRAGLFRNYFAEGRNFTDLFLNTDRDGNADHLILADPSARYGSVSGEVRATWTSAARKPRHTVHLIARGRDQTRRYGGNDTFDFGRAKIGVVQALPEPKPQYGPQTRDKIRQKTLALAYEGLVTNWLKVNAGVQRTDYSKRSAEPGLPVARRKDKPWLYNIAAAAEPVRGFALYASYTTGLEEGGIAPENASNSGFAAPALETRQIDGGLRYAITKDLTAIAGAFEVRKPYYNVDSTGVFRQIGAVRQRGIELSLAGQLAKGLRVVGGTVLLDPQVLGEDVDSGRIGKRPVGQSRRVTSVTLDYSLASVEGLSVSTSVMSNAKRTANQANTLSIPARAVVSAGARYRFRIGEADATLSAKVDNLFNKFGWRTNEAGVFLTNEPRRFNVSVAADL